MAAHALKFQFRQGRRYFHHWSITAHITKVGQNRKYTPYMTVYLVMSLPKIPYIYGSGQPYTSPMHHHPKEDSHRTSRTCVIHSVSVGASWWTSWEAQNGMDFWPLVWHDLPTLLPALDSAHTRRLQCSCCCRNASARPVSSRTGLLQLSLLQLVSSHRFRTGLLQLVCSTGTASSRCGCRCC